MALWAIYMLFWGGILGMGFTSYLERLTQGTTNSCEVMNIKWTLPRLADHQRDSTSMLFSLCIPLQAFLPTASLQLLSCRSSVSPISGLSHSLEGVVSDYTLSDSIFSKLHRLALLSTTNERHPLSSFVWLNWCKRETRLRGSLEVSEPNRCWPCSSASIQIDGSKCLAWLDKTTYFYTK